MTNDDAMVPGRPAFLREKREKVVADYHLLAHESAETASEFCESFAVG
jgi:hypothetical protein